MKKKQSYRTSHSSVGYSDRYTKTYSKGYYYEQWKQIELPILNMLFDEVSSAGAKKLLDFACGTGRILSVAENFFADTTGVDVSSEMLTRAEKDCAKSRLLCQDITSEPINESFDLVTAFRFFLNAEEELRNSAIEAISTALDEGGIFIANVHVNASSPLGIFYRIRNIFREDYDVSTLSHFHFTRLLESHGFVIQRTVWYGFFPRIGWHFGSISAKLMGPVERMGTSAWVPNQLAQSFVIVCKKEGGARA